MNKKLMNLLDKSKNDLKDVFSNIENICLENSRRVLNAFIENNVSETDFNSSTGYGYNDIGRDKVEKVFASVLGCEDTLVRNQFISGTHALTVSLFGILRPNDVMLSITGKPYDTLDEVIGIVDNNSSLKSFGIKYEEIELVDDDFDYDKISNYLKENNPKIVYIQRSKGYSTRKSLNVDKVKKVCSLVKSINKNQIIMVDNCYCEFVESITPVEAGADIMVGSLIKNLGAGIASNGAYVAGKKEYVELISERLTVPGQGKEVGPTSNMNKEFLKGLFFAPSVVASSLKTAVLTSYLLENLGYDVEPKYNDLRADIVQNIVFRDKDKLINYIQKIQANSPIDSNVVPVPCDSPGYIDPIIMASGSFTQGSSIEFSCDGPVRSPYIAYQQGGLTYEYGSIAVINAINSILE